MADDEKVVEPEGSRDEAEATTDGEDAAADEAAAGADKKAAADAVIAQRKASAPQVTRRTVTSRRVTPKGGPTAAAKAKPAKDDPPASESKARDAKKTEATRRSAPPTPARAQVYEKGPSPWWVPTIMFVLLIAGALLIMTNYMGVFGDASNIRLVIGLGLILGGIVTATQYR